MTAQASPNGTTAGAGASGAGATAGVSGAKTGIPKNPGRADLGLKATLLFPSKSVVEEYYVPLIYTACRTCYSELAPEEIFRRAVAGEIEPAKMQRLISNVIEAGHRPTNEHVVFTFGISGGSRTLSPPPLRPPARGGLAHP